MELRPASSQHCRATQTAQHATPRTAPREAKVTALICEILPTSSPFISYVEVCNCNLPGCSCAEWCVTRRCFAGASVGSGLPSLRQSSALILLHLRLAGVSAEWVLNATYVNVVDWTAACKRQNSQTTAELGLTHVIDENGVRPNPRLLPTPHRAHSRDCRHAGILCKPC